MPKHDITFIPANLVQEDTGDVDRPVVIQRDPWEDTLTGLANAKTRSVSVPRSKDIKRKQVIDAFQDAFQLIGGTPRLAIWADENPTEFYRLYSKLMPKETNTESTGEMKILHVLPRGPLD